MIRVENVTQRFGRTVALNDISFEVPPGMITGFVGANGAGKTTMMRLMVTLDSPTQGRIQVGGFDTVTAPDRVRAITGFAPDHMFVSSGVEVLDHLDFLARIHGLRGSQRQKRVDEVLELTGLKSIAADEMKGLSKGTLQRICVAGALIHQPRVLVLDEPAAGLDPIARVGLRHLLSDLAGQGVTVFISSHIIDELEEMCGYFVFVDKGALLRAGAPESLVARTGAKLRVAVLETTAALADWARLEPGVQAVAERGSSVEVELTSDTPETIAAFSGRLVGSGFRLLELRRLDEPNVAHAFFSAVAANGEGLR